VQYDRTANFWLGPTNIYFGTTAEPGSTLGPNWHVESDLTDYSPIFMTAQQGTADIGNLVNTTYTGIIYATSTLEFYPLANRQTAPVTANEVFALSAGATGGTVSLSSSTDTLSGTFTLPTNIQNAYLDVYAQSQYDDEFWYTCVPNDVSGELYSCGNTAFRETEISIDGTPAGVAPVRPWIFTGGIDPYLWQPIPGAQTLDFKPYRVDLTPFAGVLANGQHTVAVSVFNADSYFLATANLLVFTDHGSKSVTGGILSNNLAAPTPTVVENITTTSSGSTGTVTVGSGRNFTIRGYINTSHGRVETTIQENVKFKSTQTFNVNANTEIQNAVQTSTVDSTTTTRDGFLETTEKKRFSYPLTVDYSFVVNPDGSVQQVVSADQNFQTGRSGAIYGFPTGESDTSNEVTATDTLSVNAAGVFSGPTDSKTTQTYIEHSEPGGCYSRTLTAVEQVLTAETNGKGCKANTRF
jgi:hypothetical protein